MAQQTSLKSLTLSAFSLGLGILLLPSLFLPVSSRELGKENQSLQKDSVSFVTFKPPKDGMPDETAEGASRGNDCSQNAIALAECVIPLVPPTQNRLTVTERPTFFIYVPQTSAKEIFFGLIDEKNNFHYQTKIPISNQTGIVAFTLPEQASPLELGQKYRWTFILMEGQTLKPDSPGVRGEIQRVQLTTELMSQLQNKSLLERAALYGENGIWYDILTTLAQARREQPSNSTLSTAWQQLLNSVGLDAIATQPLLN